MGKSAVRNKERTTKTQRDLKKQTQNKNELHMRQQRQNNFEHVDNVHVEIIHNVKPFVEP